MAVNLHPLVVAVRLTHVTGEDGAYRGFDPEGNLGGGVAFSGWQNVTGPVDATGSGTRYDIGGGNNYGTSLADIPWQSLGAGDAINVYNTGTPYYEKIVFTEAGTAENPIIFNGVTDILGNRPVIDGDGAVNVSPLMYTDPALYSALVFFHRKPTPQGGTFGQTADHIHFQNMHVRNARSNFSYTHDGVTSAYPDVSRGIWIFANEYIKVEGCIIENAGEGLFAGSPGEKPTKTLHIKNNRFLNNGFPRPPADFDAHQLYMVSYCDPDENNIIEGNYFDQIGYTSVAQCKLRSPGLIVRYNTFRKGGRTLDIVEAQDTCQDAIWTNYTPQQILDKYRTSYVYGNLFIIDEDLDATGFAYPCHFGWDSLETYLQGPAQGEITGRGVGSPTYFYNNTIHYKIGTATTYRGGVFDVDGANTNTNTSQIVAMNNIIEFSSDGRVGIMRHTGQLDFEGANLINSSSLTILAESDSYANTENSGDDPAVLINNNDTRITTSAQFVDSTNADVTLRDYSLSVGSPAIGVASPLLSPMSSLPPLSTAVSPANGTSTQRATLNNLGAFE